MGYRNYIRAVRKNWWIVVLAVVLAVGAGVLATITLPKLYAQ